MVRLKLIFRLPQSSSTSKTDKDSPKKDPSTNLEQPQHLIEGSLHHALVTNPSKYLWADPMAWHAGHLEVLDCPRPYSTQLSVPPSSPRDNDYPEETKGIYKNLYSQWHLADSRNMYLREIISGVIMRKRYALGLQDTVLATRGLVNLCSSLIGIHKS
jgi:hypothetical protein